MRRSGLTAGLALGTIALLALTACAPRGGGSDESKTGVSDDRLVESLPPGEPAVDPCS